MIVTRNCENKLLFQSCGTYKRRLSQLLFTAESNYFKLELCLADCLSRLLVIVWRLILTNNFQRIPLNGKTQRRSKDF